MTGYTASSCEITSCGAAQRQWHRLTEPVSKEEVTNERSTRGSIRRISQPYRIFIAATAARCGGICVSG